MIPGASEAGPDGAADALPPRKSEPSMIEQLVAIVRNTFYESIRQPVVLVVLVAASLLLVLSNPLAAFTMDDDQKMLLDIGLATIFLAGVLLAALVATGVLGREIENKTALTVVSKPVPRPLFVIGKFLGVAAALLLCTVGMSMVFLLVELHTVLQTVRDPVRVPVIVFGVGAAVVGVGVATWANYFYERVFTSTVIVITVPLLTVAYFLSLFFDHEFAVQPPGTDLDLELWKALVVMWMAVMVITAVAVAASARLGQVMTLVVTLAVFLVGLLSDWLVGRRIRGLREIWLDRARGEGLVEQEQVVREFTLRSGEIQRSAVPETVDVATVPLASLATTFERVEHTAWWVVYAIVPNLQKLFLADALTQDRLIPMSYVLQAVLYGGFMTLAAVALAVLLFQRREVG